MSTTVHTQVRITETRVNHIRHESLPWVVFEHFKSCDRLKGPLIQHCITTFTYSKETFIQLQL